MKYNNFLYALSLLNTMYGIELDDEDFIEKALVGWNLIGNKRTKLYKTLIETSKGYNGECGYDSIDLPCNCDEILAITYPYEDANLVSNTSAVNNRIANEEWNESTKHNTSPLYLQGKFCQYEISGDKIHIQEPTNKVNILYRGYVVDDNELPEISDKEAMALATYVAYVEKYKQGLMTNNPNIILISNTLRLKWLLQCDLARVDYPMTLNDYNDILDARNCWDRKLYKTSYKLIR